MEEGVRILRIELDRESARESYFLHQEEVPRAGIIVTRTSNAPVGSKSIHLDRAKKRNWRGEGASGLVFDQIVPVKNPPAENQG